MPSFDDVFSAAESLVPVDRVRLVQELWQTIPPESWPAPSAEWIEEIHRRSAELDAGRMDASNWEEVRARARREVGLDE
jgi:putative addiction module component (TIGR02574 family)